MANELFSRIQLKYDSYANWTKTDVAGQGANLVLKSGELGICAIPSGSTAVNGDATRPQIMFKVGDGTSAFSALPWASAKAADVYDWAKKSEADFTTWVKGLIDIGDIDLSNYATKSYAESEADAAESAAKTYADGLITALNMSQYATKEYADKAESDAIDAAKKYADGLADNYATAEQGGKADTAVQSATFAGTAMTKDGTALSITKEAAREALGMSDYATVANLDKYGLKYNETDKEFYLVDENGNQQGDAIDATPFIKDGMLSKVEYDESTNTITFTWNTDSGLTTDTVVLSDIIDPYTAKDTDTIDLTIDGTEISADVKDGSITETHLSTSVNASLDKADSAVQSIKVLGETLTDGGELTVDEAKTALGLGTAAYTNSGAYATSSQGALAESAIQKIVEGTGINVNADAEAYTSWTNVAYTSEGVAGIVIQKALPADYSVQKHSISVIINGVTYENEIATGNDSQTRFSYITDIAIGTSGTATVIFYKRTSLTVSVNTNVIATKEYADSLLETTKTDYFVINCGSSTEVI